MEKNSPTTESQDDNILQETAKKLAEKYGEIDWIDWFIKEKEIEILQFTCNGDDKAGLYSLTKNKVILEPTQLSDTISHEVSTGLISFMRYNHQPTEYIDYDGLDKTPKKI